MYDMYDNLYDNLCSSVHHADDASIHSAKQANITHEEKHSQKESQILTIVC